MDLYSLPTPCLVLDIDRVKRNIAGINDRVRSLGTRLRPHVKTHKCVELARLQTAGHSGALTVSTLAEARVFAANGFTDITYAVPIEPGKFNAALEIIQKGVRLSLITDDPAIPPLLDEAAGRAGVKIPVLLEVDCGYHRTGVEPRSLEALATVRCIVDSKHLLFEGLLTHAGHSYHCVSREEVLAVARIERDSMVGLAEELRAKGISVPVISIGSTPTITHVDHLTGIDEVRPGNYIFFDAFQATLGSCSFDDCALTVLASVVHRDAVRRKVAIDAGAIALSKDLGAVDLDPLCGYGVVCSLEGKDVGLRVHSVSQEHGMIPVEDDGLFCRLKVGARLRIAVNHSCLAAAQHGHYNILERGEIVDQWKIHQGW
jgi:D-serine deaminase-like pyridoxal phosphate-dependent protein